MANNPTRRSLLKAATGVAAYGAGVAALSAGAAVVSSGTAKGATEGVSPELARLIADHDRKHKAANRYQEEVYEPAREQMQAAADAVPHIEVKGIDGYDGGPQVWSTDQNHRVTHAKWAVRQPTRFWGPGGEAGLAAHKAQRRLVAASLWRQRAINRIKEPNSREHQCAVHMIGVDRKLPRNNLRCIWSTLDERRDFDLRCAEIEVLRAEYALENARIDRLSEIEGTPWWDERSTRRPLIEANRDRWEVIRERITQLAETPARTRQHLEKKLRMIGKAWLALDSEFGERLRAGVAADEAWLDQHQPKRTRKGKQQ